ncbi:MAG: adenosine deaminase [Candidatus Nanoarchaeia archaeon]|nr:adenosine deaminase [Candidatus Nanoarchaeia archaeon]
MTSELHLHLDGSMRIKTLIELARHDGIKLSSYEPDELLEQIKFKQGMTQEECLNAFSTTLSVMQTKYAISRIAYEICEDQRNKGIDYAEIRYCPFLHQQNGLRIEEIVSSVHNGLSMGEKDFGIKTAQIFCALRHENEEHSIALADLACYFSKRYPEYKIAGFDLACAEANNPPWRHDKAFEIVKNAGLKTTVHAGEVPESFYYLRYAICTMGADRIGHGTLLIKDEMLMESAKRLGTTIECCVTSNVHTGIIKSVEEHPAKKLFDRGVKIAFCADNTLLSQTTAEKEYRIAKKFLGFSDKELEKVKKYSDEARFR